MWSRTILALGMAAAAVTLPIGSTYSQSPSFEPAAYSTRLRLPFRNDRLGISRGVTADPVTGEIFISDWRYGRIVIFDDRLLFRYIMAGDRFTTSPNEVAIDPEGFLLVLPSDGKSLIYLDFDGAYLGELKLKDLPPDLRREPRLVSVALSPDGKTIYTLDGNNQRVWLAGRDGSIIHSVDLGAELDDQEQRDFIFGHVDAYDRTLMVAVPTDGLILLFDLEGQPLGFVGRKGTASCQTAFPKAAALDAEGRVLILDNQRALVSVWQVEGNKCLGQFAGFGGAPGALYRPLDMTLDAKGRVFISQGYEGRVQVYQHNSPAAGSKEPAAPEAPTAPDQTEPVQQTGPSALDPEPPSAVPPVSPAE
jgi:hypothetical protein